MKNFKILVVLFLFSILTLFQITPGFAADPKPQDQIADPSPTAASEDHFADGEAAAYEDEMADEEEVDEDEMMDDEEDEDFDGELESFDGELDSAEAPAADAVSNATAQEKK